MPNQTAPLDHERVRRELAASRFSDLRYVAETGSTNADAQALLGDPAARGTVIIAEYQSAGSGRKGRRWFAPPGSSLLFTAILPDPIAVERLWAVPFWAALAVAHAIHMETKLWADLIWPNDLAAAGGKVGGILSVSRISGDEAWVGVGIGLNVYRPASDPDLDALDPAPAFLSDRVAVDREALAIAILKRLDTTAAALLEPAAVAMAWATRAALPGTRYYYRRDDDGIEREGIALEIAPGGGLVLLDHGKEITIDMADVRVIGRGL